MRTMDRKTSAGVPFVIEGEVLLRYTHRMLFTRAVFDPCNLALVDAVHFGGGRAAPVAFVIDSGVDHAWPRLAGDAVHYAGVFGKRLELRGTPLVVPGGEVCKNSPDILEQILDFIEGNHLCRHSTLVAVGGGAVLDVAGYAAAIAHRGIRLVRVPTTTLAMADSAVGVKNGINAYGKKNFLGAFAVPSAVLCDELILETLSERDWLAGFSEAVKVALIKDAEYFAQLEESAAAIRGRSLSAAMPVIRRSAALHHEHIVRGGDPFEMTTARPLDFGHWSAHKLEKLTNFELRHGEAVAIGIALDSAYSTLMGWLPEADLERILALLHALGLPAHHELLGTEALVAGIEEFREHLGGALTLAMLGGIGRERLAHEMDASVLKQAAELLSRRSA